MSIPYINEALRILRKSKELETKQVAEKLEVSPSYISKIESGLKSPNFILIQKYAELFEIKPSLLIYFAEDLERDISLRGNLIKSICRFAKILEEWKQP